MEMKTKTVSKLIMLLMVQGQHACKAYYVRPTHGVQRPPLSNLLQFWHQHFPTCGQECKPHSRCEGYLRSSPTQGCPGWLGTLGNTAKTQWGHHSSTCHTMRTSLAVPVAQGYHWQYLSHNKDTISGTCHTMRTPLAVPITQIRAPCSTCHKKQGTRYSELSQPVPHWNSLSNCSIAHGIGTRDWVAIFPILS